jgi:ribosomal protein L7/L12
VRAVDFGWGTSDRKITRIERRLGLMERKIDAMLEHLGIPFTEPGFEEVDTYLRAGKKLQAIKAYRDRTGAGLAEAKEAVERMGGER